MVVDILGTEYKIYYRTIKEEPCLENLDGYCNMHTKEIIILDFNTYKKWENETQATRDIIMKATLRHEIIHAFLGESGLQESSSSTERWAVNEEMVDWIALQSPKIFKAFKECECL